MMHDDLKYECTVLNYEYYYDSTEITLSIAWENFFFFYDAKQTKLLQKNNNKKDNYVFIIIPFPWVCK